MHLLRQGTQRRACPGKLHCLPSCTAKLLQAGEPAQRACRRSLTGEQLLQGEVTAPSAAFSPSLPARLCRTMSGCHTKQLATPSDPPNLAWYNPRARLACVQVEQALGKAAPRPDAAVQHRVHRSAAHAPLARAACAAQIQRLPHRTCRAPLLCLLLAPSQALHVTPEGVVAAATGRRSVRLLGSSACPRCSCISGVAQHTACWLGLHAVQPLPCRGQGVNGNSAGAEERKCSGHGTQAGRTGERKLAKLPPIQRTTLSSPSLASNL